MTSPHQRYRNFSSDSVGRERMASEEVHYQGMLKATDGRKGTSMAAFARKYDKMQIILTCSLA